MRRGLFVETSYLAGSNELDSATSCPFTYSFEMAHRTNRRNVLPAWSEILVVRGDFARLHAEDFPANIKRRVEDGARATTGAHEQLSIEYGKASRTAPFSYLSAKMPLRRGQAPSSQARTF